MATKILRYGISMSRIFLILIGAVIGPVLSAGFLTIMVLAFRPKFLPSRKTLIEWLTLLRKISWRYYFEANLRAQTGKPLDRPYGAKRGILSFEKLLFNPVYLAKTPLNKDKEIDTTVILGPQARKPLHLRIPIIIEGMAYGSGYSLAAKNRLGKGGEPSRYCGQLRQRTVFGGRAFLC